jgi:hypothetical protein
LYHAHAYPTKISPESIALLIACHTEPGDLIYDGFGGSGTTAIATLLSSRPTEGMRAEAERLGLNPCWGPRRALVHEISGMGSFIGSTLCARPAPAAFLQAAKNVLAAAERECAWMYAANDPNGAEGIARYFIWSERLECPACRAAAALWDGCVRLSPAAISDAFLCPACGKATPIAEIERAMADERDDLLGATRRVRERSIARVSGGAGGEQWTRPPRDSDLALLERIAVTPIPPGVPVAPMMGRGGEAWGDLWRAGYHEGITHAHHFYTRRNLIVLGTLHSLIEDQPASMRDALRLWISSYNSSHSTLMTRVVAKRGQPNLVLTSAQPGVLYISGLPVEKNVLLGLRRKMTTLTEAFALLRDTDGEAQVRWADGTRTDLPDGSVDYVFTDPPFGGNIPYSEVNFLAETWLDRMTQPRGEAIVSPAQGKGLAEYEALLESSFREARRILKPDGHATVIFHSTQANVWGALDRALTRAGFAVELSNILDKRQGSFKQVTTRNMAKGDPMLLLTPRTVTPALAPDSTQIVIARLLDEARTHTNADERLPERLYSRFVSHYLERSCAPPMDADAFYGELATARGA